MSPNPTPYAVAFIAEAPAYPRPTYPRATCPDVAIANRRQQAIDIAAALVGTNGHLVYATRQKVNAPGTTYTMYAAAIVYPGQSWTPEDWYDTADEAAIDWQERAYEIADEHATPAPCAAPCAAPCGAPCRVAFQADYDRLTAEMRGVVFRTGADYDRYRGLQTARTCREAAYTAALEAHDPEGFAANEAEDARQTAYAGDEAATA